jgi:hypothetical protein
MILPLQQQKPKTMKTKMNISNLKKLAIAACAALLMIAGNLTQLRAEGDEASYLISLNRLESLMNSTEQAIRYAVPEVYESKRLPCVGQNGNDGCNRSCRNMKSILKKRNVANGWQGGVIRNRSYAEIQSPGS